MIPLNLKEIINFTKPLKIITNQEIPNKLIKNIYTDSRKIENNSPKNLESIFICIKGEKFDGHNFIDQVISKNVKIVVIENENKISSIKDKSTIFIVTKNTLKFLGKLAELVIHKKRQIDKDFKIIAIAGSAGKTTTKNILKNILEFSGFNTIASQKSFNNEIGVPLTIFNISEDTDVLVLEMGMRGFNQIDYLCQISQPNYGIITTIGPEHLEFVNNISGVIKAETELTNFLKKQNNYFIIPSKIKNIYKNYKNFDYLPNKDNYLKNYKIFLSNNDFQTSVDLFINKKLFKINIDYIISNSIMYNFLVCLKMLEKFDNQKIYEVIKNSQNLITNSLEKDRFYPEKIKNQYLMISDFYNSNYLSLKENLKIIESLFKYFDRILLIIGDMLELGKYTDFYHKKVLERFRNYPRNVKIVCIGKNFYSNKKFNSEINFYIETEDLVKDISKYILQDRMLIFIKGSRALALEKVYQTIKALV